MCVDDKNLIMEHELEKKKKTFIHVHLQYEDTEQILC